MQTTACLVVYPSASEGGSGHLGIQPPHHTYPQLQARYVHNPRQVRQFNKRFYEEFRREAQKHDKSKANSRRASGAAPGTSKHQVSTPATKSATSVLF